MRLLDLQDSHFIRGAGLATAATLDLRNGQNAGNFAFRYALFERLFPLAEPCAFDAINDLDAPGECVLIACSNWIGQSEAHEQANLTRSQSLGSAQVVASPFGLGCQLPMDAGIDGLGPHTLRLLELLCDRSPSMSLRDAQTARLLQAMGYQGGVVTGCPSNFIHAAPGLGQRLLRRVQRLLDAGGRWHELATCLTEYSGGYDFSADVFARQFALLRSHGATYVIQDLPMLPLLLGETDTPPVEYSLQHFPGMADSDRDLALLLRRHALYYSSFDEWLLQMRRFDLCFGMRLHGNMAALQAGVPALVITHDARTAQLCETMSLPHLAAQDYLGMRDDDATALLAAMLPALEHYDAQRAQLARTLRQHIVRCGLPVAPFLDRLCDETLPDPDALQAMAPPGAA